jgi:hydroxymethylbilane synthase
MLPAPGQGALGIECLASDSAVIALLAPLADAGASACVRAERAVSRELGGSCTIPLGAYAELTSNDLVLRALVAAPDGRRIARAQIQGPASQPEALGARAAAELRSRGADEILSSIAK